MIRNQWYVVLESNEVNNRPIGATRLGEKMVFWRDQAGMVNAALDRCPHRGVALSAGDIQAGHVQCPFHGFEFDALGKCVLIPANGRNGVIPNAMRLNSYPTYEAHGLIWLWWGSQPPVELPAPLPGGRGGYFKARSRATWDFALAGVASSLQLEGDAVKRARLVLSGVAPAPWHASAAEQELVGHKLDADAIARAAAASVKDASPLSNNGYKVTLLRGAVEEALSHLA